MDPISLAVKAAFTAALHETLPQAVHDAVLEALPSAVRLASLPLLLTRAELAELTGWSLRKVDSMRQSGRLPYVRVGRAVRFRTSDVEALLDEARVAARVDADAA
ncbi:helix-turn-helix domain-containing protein [Rubrivirga sp.]|uniref:helix-turn-helix domain-containing protein n=1 Tax=Rubrivirga sp. TaxID=1885344 RepID=UPI003C73A84F